MILTIVNVIYVLVAVAMITLILLQRGAGTAAGSGFGGGASATVFGARGSANFLSKSTAVLATIFMVMSLGMAVHASRTVKHEAGGDLGVMGATAPAAEIPQAAQPAELPAPSDAVPPAPEAAPSEPAPAQDETPVEKTE